MMQLVSLDVKSQLTGILFLLGKFSQYDSDTRSWFIMEHFCFI